MNSILLLNHPTSAFASEFATGEPATPAAAPGASVDPTRHAHLLECLVLKEESHEAFTQLFEHYLRKVNPLDSVEYGIVEQMAAATWRLRRRCAVELDRISASRHCSDRELQEVLDRYESRLQREHRKSLDLLRSLRSLHSFRRGSIESTPQLPNEPENLPDHEKTRNCQTNPSHTAGGRVRLLTSVS